MPSGEMPAPKPTRESGLVELLPVEVRNGEAVWPAPPSGTGSAATKLEELEEKEEKDGDCAISAPGAASSAMVRKRADRFMDKTPGELVAGSVLTLPGCTHPRRLAQSRQAGRPGLFAAYGGER